MAAVGQLQFDVVQHRMQAEYGVETLMEPLSYSIARWAEGGWEAVDKAKQDGKLDANGMAALRASARVEVTKVDPKWLLLLPIPSWSITEASPTLGG